MSSVCVVIQARLGSTRFPNKILADLDGKPLIQHVVERARQIRGVDDVIVAVSDTPTKDAIEALGLAVRVVRPAVPPDDVLGRYAAVACQFPSHDVFVRVTGDCPLLDSEIASDTLAEFFAGGHTYWSNLKDGYVDGTDVEVFTRDRLLEADREAKTSDEREHVTLWMRGGEIVTPDPVKLSVDTEEDLARVRAMLVSERA